ncbi:MAG: glycosyltransferase [Candidatus Altiarchaeota archaeon]|nr:glycosyltransferase [Candidatus Altiarchaeota archaeon]
MKTQKKTPKLSVVVATHNRQAQLKRCIDSVYSSDFNQNYEVIVVVNGECKKSIKLLRELSRSRKNLIYYKIEKTTLGATRNHGISKAQGDILYFIDDDVIVPQDNLSKVVGLFSKHADVDVLGGPNISPIESSRFQRYSGYVLQTYFGAANMRYRYGSFGKNTPADERMLILCNLAIRADSLKKSKVRFDSDVVRNEENILLQHMTEKGHKMIYMPDLIMYHDRRKNIYGFASQLFMYGRGRIQNIAKYPETFNPLFIMPAMLVVDTIIYFVTSNALFAAPIITYLLLDFVSSSVKSYREKDIISFFALLFLFPIAHFSYGLGFTYEILKNGSEKIFSRL